MPKNSHKETLSSSGMSIASSPSNSGFFSSSDSVALIFNNSLDARKQRTRQLCEESGLDVNAFLKAIKAECKRKNKEEHINRVIASLTELDMKEGISYLQFQKRQANLETNSQLFQNSSFRTCSSTTLYVSSILVCIVSVPLSLLALYGVLTSSLPLDDGLKLVIGLASLLATELLLFASSVFLFKLSANQLEVEDKVNDLSKHSAINPFHFIVQELTESTQTSVDFSGAESGDSFAENDSEDDYDDRLQFRA